jgi:hypothetical protein
MRIRRKTFLSQQTLTIAWFHKKKNPSPCFLRNDIANNVFSAAEWILKDIEIKVIEGIEPGQD